MNDQPRHILARIIARHGRRICDSPKRVEWLMRDLAGAYRREINVLTGALEEGVAAELMRANKSAPRDVTLARLARRLQDNLAYTPDAAGWAVDSWAFALGVLTEVDLAARESANDKARDTQRGDRAAPRDLTRAPTPAPPAPIPASPPQSTPPRLRAPVRPTPSSAPSMRPPLAPLVGVPSVNAPPIISPRRAHAAPPAPAPQTPPSVQPPSAPRRGWKLRGCFITLLLVVVLIVGALFVAPAIIAILREEQAQPSINDPRFD